MTATNDTVDVDETETSPGTRLARLRREKGWSIEQLAARGKVKPGHLVDVEEGARRFNAPVLARLTKILLTEHPEEPTRRRRRAASAPKHVAKRKVRRAARAVRSRPPALTSGTNGHAERAVIVLRGADYKLAGDGSMRDRVRLTRALEALVRLRSLLPKAHVELDLPPGRYALTPEQAAVLAGTAE